MEKLYELYRHLGNSLDLEETCATLDRELRRVVDYEAISVDLVDGEGLTPVYMRGVAPCALRIPVGDVAVLAVYRAGTRGFSVEEQETLETLVPKLAATIANCRRYQRMERLAGIDPVTGLLNARALFQRLDAEIARARRESGKLAVLECEVPWGSAVGCPGQPTAEALSQCCREYDFAAWTGDNFVLVLPGFARTDLAEKCSHIQSLVGAVRIGAAFYPDDGQDAEDLLAAASRRRLKR